MDRRDRIAGILKGELGEANPWSTGRGRAIDAILALGLDSCPLREDTPHNEDKHWCYAGEGACPDDWMKRCQLFDRINRAMKGAIDG